MEKDVLYTLALLQENGGRFPQKGDGPPPGSREHMDISPELPYESRYFSVLLSASGGIITVDTGKIAAVDTESAIAFAKSVWEDGKERGFLRNYRFIQYQDGEEIRVIFLDCGRNLSTFRSFLLASLGICALGLLAVLGLILLFSRWMVRPVSESYEKQKRFITDAGHEIKTPITIIGADAQVLEMELGENEWLRDIQLQTKRLSALTNELIQLSRMEEQYRLQMIEFPFSDLVTETAQSFQALAVTQDKEFTAQIQPMISLYGDESALRQLVTILLDNALKYAPAQGKIHLSLQKQGKSVRLAVENTVEALPAQNLEHLFDRFYRGDQSRSSQTGGYGLGLSIAKAIVDAHKGKIRAWGQEGPVLVMEAVFPPRKEKGRREEEKRPGSSLEERNSQ